MLLLLNFKNMNILIVTILMSAITVLIYGSGQILLMNYPGRFHLWGLTATVGGIVNAFASFGNVIASYGSGFVADNFGWSAMIVIWNALVLLFVVLTIIMIPMWKKFRRRE
jgi:sugar phosphate permease